MEYPTERESNIVLKRRNFNWSLAGWGQQNRNIPISKIRELERHLSHQLQLPRTFRHDPGSRQGLALLRCFDPDANWTFAHYTLSSIDPRQPFDGANALDT